MLILMGMAKFPEKNFEITWLMYSFDYFLGNQNWLNKINYQLIFYNIKDKTEQNEHK